MSYSDPVELVQRGWDGSVMTSATDRLFTRQATLPDGSVFIDVDPALALGEPVNLIVQNSRTGKTPNVRDRHRLAIVRTEIGADNIERKSTVALTVELPIHADFTADKIFKDISALLSLLGVDVAEDGTFNGINVAPAILRLIRSES